MVWKRLVYQGIDYGDYYLVSDAGCLMNAKTRKIRRLNVIGSKGYYGCVISLGSRNRKICVRIHKAVAETFIPNPYCKPEVNHIDGNKSHNYVDNLEWATTKENMAHSVANGLNNMTYGEQHGSSKLTKSQIDWVRSVYMPGDKQFGVMALSRKLMIDHSTLHSILTNKTWRC